MIGKVRGKKRQKDDQMTQLNATIVSRQDTGQENVQNQNVQIIQGNLVCIVVTINMAVINARNESVNSVKRKVIGEDGSARALTRLHRELQGTFTCLHPHFHHLQR